MKIKLGTNQAGKPIHLNTDKLFSDRLLCQGISGSQKSETVNTILRKMKLEYEGGIQQIIFDWEGEREKFQNFGQYIMLGKYQGSEDGLTIEEAFGYAQEVRRIGASVIIDLSSYETLIEREQITDQFIKGILLDNEKQYWKPCVVMIDEAHNLCRQSGKCESRDSVIRLCETGRKRQMAVILVTQRLAQLNKNASAQCANRMIGKTIELADRDNAGRLIGLPKGSARKLAELQGGEFFIFGTAFDAIEYQKLKVDRLTPSEVAGFVLKPQERLEHIEEKFKKISREEENNELREMIQELAKSVKEAELVGYTKAMLEVMRYLDEDKGFWGRKKPQIEFKEILIDGIKVITIKRDTDVVQAFK